MNLAWYVVGLYANIFTVILHKVGLCSKLKICQQKRNKYFYQPLG